MGLTRVVCSVTFALCAGAACRHHVEPPVVVAVPDRSQRLVFAIPADSAAARRVVDSARIRIVCLAGHPTADARGCDRRPNAEPSCNRNRAAIAATLGPVLTAVPTLRWTDSTESELRRRFPDFVVAVRQLRDARRSYRCETWDAGKCLAVAPRSQGIWLMLTAPARSERVETVTVFLGRENLCDRAGTPAVR
jgi:hypothetical protein